MTTGFFLAMAGIASAVSIAGIGSAIGISYPAAAAAGVMSEDSKDFGKYLMLVALPGTQGIYGFVISLLWMNQLKVMSATESIPALSWNQGLMVLFACLPVGICGLSAVFQGRACAAGVNLVAKRSEDSAKALIMGVFVEFYAVLGLLVSIFVINYADKILLATKASGN